MGRIADISWPKKILAVSSIYIVGLLSVGAVGGYTIYAQNRATGDALKVSQARGCSRQGSGCHLDHGQGPG